MTRSSPLHTCIETGLAELSLESPSQTIDALAKLSELVARWGSRINLTGHRDADAIARRLVLDAAALQAALAPVASLADLGSGAGFPGLPMAILRPELEVVLIEARERRHYFQRHAIRELGLSNVRARRGRIEEIIPERCEAVVAQAVAPPDEMTPWMLRWALPGATLIVPGGTSPRISLASDGLAASRQARYQVPLGGPVRTIWLATVL